MELTEQEQKIVLELVNSISLGNIAPEILKDFVDLKLKLESNG